MSVARANRVLFLAQAKTGKRLSTDAPHCSRGRALLASGRQRTGANKSSRSTRLNRRWLKRSMRHGYEEQEEASQEGNQEGAGQDDTDEEVSEKERAHRGYRRACGLGRGEARAAKFARRSRKDIPRVVCFSFGSSGFAACEGGSTPVCASAYGVAVSPMKTTAVRHTFDFRSLRHPQVTEQPEATHHSSRLPSELLDVSGMPFQSKFIQQTD